MAAALADPTKFALPVAASFFYQMLQILHLLLGFLEGSPARGPALDAAVIGFLLAYAAIIAGVAVVTPFIHDINRPVARAPLALWLFYAQAVIWFSALFLVIGILIGAFLVRAAGGR